MFFQNNLFVTFPPGLAHPNISTRGTTMSDTKLLPRRATDPLKMDHRVFAQIFKDFAKLDEWSVEQKIEMFRMLADRLAVHAAIEEQLFYPALQRNVPAEDRPPILEAREE